MKHERKPREEPERSYPVNIRCANSYAAYRHLMAQGTGAIFSALIQERGNEIISVSIRPPAGLTYVDMRRL